MLAFLDKIPFGTPRLRRILFWLLTTFTVYVLVGFFAVPPALKSLITSQTRAVLGRDGTVKRVAFNPLTLRLEIDGLAVAKLEGEGDLFSVEKIDATAGLSSLWKFAPVVSELKLISPKVDITFFGDGRYSISDLIGAREKGKEPPADKEAAAVFPFALYGFEMSNATIVFDDQPHEKKHVISQLDLVVPFTSSFLSLRKEYTQPKFTAVVNGDPVELTGRTLPFDKTLRTEFKLGAVNVDLAQYWGYLPITTPLELESGHFTSEISLLFERPDAQRMNLFLGGGGKLTGLKLRDKAEGTVFSLRELDFSMEKYSLGDNLLALTEVTLDNPVCSVVRRKDGSVNWAGYFPADAEADAPAAAGDPQNPQPASAFILDVHKLAIKGGEVRWDDRAVDGGFKRVFGNVAVTAEDLSTREGAPCAFTASLGKTETLTVKGTTSISPSLDGNATLTGNGINLPDFKAYYANALPLELDRGTAGFSLTTAFRSTAEGTDLDVVGGTLNMAGLALRKPEAKNPSLALDELAVSGVKVDLKGRDLAVDEVRLTGPDVRLVREKSGQLDLVRLFAGDEKDADPDDGGGDDGAPWTAMIHAVRVSGGEAEFIDRAQKTPMHLGVDNVAVSLDNLTTRDGAETPFAISASWAGKGRLETKGKAVLSPLKANGTLTLNGLSLRPLDGLLDEHADLLFASGRADADIAFSFEAGEPDKVSVTGKAGLRDVQFKDIHGDGELAGFEELDFMELRLTGEPYRLDLAAIHLKAPRISIDIDETGNSNVRRALRLPPPAPDAGAAAQAAPESAGAKDKKKEQTGNKTEAKQEDKAKDEPDAEEPDALAAVTIGKVSMVGGLLRFRDASVHPTYSMTLSEMGLVLTGLSRQPDARPKFDFMAKLGPTPVHVVGVLNPLVSPPYSDLMLSVTGMELVPLTPYTLRNLAYPIEKGRLYADVKFKTEDWLLTADNKFFIEQLVLGPKDKRPGAPNVPVQFGLSLLQDSNGDLTLNLPIRGRLDDPDFRVGAIVFKAIVNLMFKALASPFSLIGSIFGGGDNANMDFVVFDPGHSNLTDLARGKLDTVAKALAERKKLKLEVDGVVDPQGDKAGLVRLIFERKLHQQKYDDLPRKERAETTVDDIKLTKDDYEEYLFEAYRDEDDPDDVRPTSLFVVDRQPIPVMEKFILDRITVTPENLDALAVDRARAVKEYLLAKDPALAERVFLLDKRKERDTKPGIPRHRADLGIK